MNGRRKQRESFGLPLPRVLLIGALLAASFFGLILLGPLDHPLVRRYCLSHPVAVASLCLFWVGLAGLALKWLRVSHQSAILGRTGSALRRLIAEGAKTPADQRPAWLAASWDAQPAKLRDSWLGARLQRTLELQVSRGRRLQVETDLRQLSDSDADRQHESYGLLRIINWAMPMLGFLGTVLGISQTLGRLDTQLLATQQQEAMNQLTAGLYVAFDTTAIALSLTVFSMFLQFAVSRAEVNLLNRIDTETNDSLIAFLATDPLNAEQTLLEPVREMSRELLAQVRELVQEQARLWSESISESQRQWSEWTERSAAQAEANLGASLRAAIHEHLTGLEKIQSEATRNIDVRWQQWQTTLSDHARITQSQQVEINRQSQTLEQLVQSTCELRNLEEVIQDSVSRLENIGRIEEATLCVGEAVTVLASSLERAGILRGAPTRPRPTQRPATGSQPSEATVEPEGERSQEQPSVSGPSPSSASPASPSPAHAATGSDVPDSNLPDFKLPDRPSAGGGQSAAASPPSSPATAADGNANSSRKAA